MVTGNKSETHYYVIEWNAMPKNPHEPGLENVWSLKPLLGCQPFMTGSSLRRLQYLRRAKSPTLTAYGSKEGRSWLLKGGPGVMSCSERSFTAPHPEPEPPKVCPARFQNCSQAAILVCFPFLLSRHVDCGYLVPCSSIVSWMYGVYVVGRSGWERGIHTLSC